ncbi:MAG: HAD family phosphatase [Candidatus Heimdallarchaeota archaeon]|nr:MAG: HAD family phosphatase [Candidatus Heimdallarchaeota archaeon]
MFRRFILFKAIILDMDGLMVDTERLYIEVEQKIASEYGKTVSKAVFAEMMGQKPLKSMEILQKFLEVDVSPFSLLKKRDHHFLRKLQKNLQPLPGLFTFLDNFAQKYKLALATGSTETITNIILTQLNISQYFNVIQTSDSVEKGKPDPEIYQKTVKRLQVQATECIVLEDSNNGIISAKRAGCYTIAVPSVYTESQDFSSADFIADNLLDAASHIKALTT